MTPVSDLNKEDDMPTTHQPLRSLLMLVVLLLGLMTTPAGSAAQDDDGDTTPAVTAAPDENTDQDDADRHDAGVDTSNADQDSDDPPDCDDEGWRIVTTEDGTGFASENHCVDHVADHGDDSLVEVGADEDGEYVVVTMTDPSGDDRSCTVTGTLVNGQDGQSVGVVIDTSHNAQLRWVFRPSRGQVSASGTAGYGEILESGTASLLGDGGRPTDKTFEVHMPNTTCT